MLCVLKTQMEHLILWDFLLSLNVGFSGLHDPENFSFIDQVKIMLDHQLHDAGCDGKIDQLLRIKTVDQAVKKPTGMLASKLRIWISLFTVGLRCKRLTVTRFW